MMKSKNKKNTGRVICWGIGADFKKIYGVLDNAVKNGSIIIDCLVDKKITEYPGFTVISPEDIRGRDMDHVIICSSMYYDEIRDELKEYGINSDQIIKGDIFLEPGFDYDYYRDRGWLNNTVIKNTFSDLTYRDEDREYKGKNVHIRLGRKSYVCEVKIEDGECDLRSDISIGNYTCISWDCRFEMGLNMDHDHRRALNYGLSHLQGIKADREKADVCRLEIGSDVWIGRGCALKSGITIGNGAVIASNSYVVSDVPDYAIVGGNPAKIIKYRFDKEVIGALLESQWWLMDEMKLAVYSDLFDDPLSFAKSVIRDKKG